MVTENLNTQIIQDNSVVETGNEQDVQLTTFFDAGSKEHAHITDPSLLPMHHTDLAVIDMVNNYFGRPQQLATGIYNSSSPLVIHSTPNVGVPLWVTHGHYPKALGAFGIRATTCFRIEVSSAPQQAGILRLCFCPFEDITHYTRANYSQMPGTNLTLNTVTTATLKVPFIHSNEFFKVNSFEEATMGTLVLVDMSTFAGLPTTGPVSWTIYWWLEDVDLIGATPSSISKAYLDARQAIIATLS